jgi:AbrB family looped-hinge helix DNA binding protein
MSHTLTSKGQVTIPKKIRDTLGLEPGSEVDFDVDAHGHIIIRKAGARAFRRSRGQDRFDRVRGRATIRWKTDELMALLRDGE